MGMSKSAMHDFSATPDAGLPEHADAGEPPMKSRFARWVGHNNGPAQSVFPAGHQMEGVQHNFAKTTDGPADRMDSGGTGNWIQKAIKRPGALTAKASKVGEKPMAFAREHASSPGRTGKQARAAINMQK